MKTRVQSQQLRGVTEVLVQKVKVQMQNFSFQTSQQSSHSPSLQHFYFLPTEAENGHGFFIFL